MGKFKEYWERGQNAEVGEEGIHLRKAATDWQIWNYFNILITNMVILVVLVKYQLCVQGDS